MASIYRSLRCRFIEDPRVIAQLKATNGACWDATYSTATVNGNEQTISRRSRTENRSELGVPAGARRYAFGAAGPGAAPPPTRRPITFMASASIAPTSLTVAGRTRVFDAFASAPN